MGSEDNSIHLYIYILWNIMGSEDNSIHLYMWTLEYYGIRGQFYPSVHMDSGIYRG